MGSRGVGGDRYLRRQHGHALAQLRATPAAPLESGAKATTAAPSAGARPADTPSVECAKAPWRWARPKLMPTKYEGRPAEQIFSIDVFYTTRGSSRLPCSVLSLFQVARPSSSVLVSNDMYDHQSRAAHNRGTTIPPSMSGVAIPSV